MGRSPLKLNQTERRRWVSKYSVFDHGRSSGGTGSGCGSVKGSSDMAGHPVKSVRKARRPFENVDN